MNDIFSLSNVLGVLGLVVAGLTYYLSRRVTRLAIQSRGIPLISEHKLQETAPGGLSIVYNDKPVERLTLSKIALWNAGNTTLQESALIAEDPLRLEFDGDIFEVREALKTRDITGIRTEINKANPRHVKILFNFLDPGDGVLLEIFHAGKQHTPKAAGTIQGMPKGVSNLGTFMEISKSEYKAILHPSLIAAALMFLLMITIHLNPEAAVRLDAKFGLISTPEAVEANSIKFAIIYPLMLLVPLATLSIRIARKRFPRKLRQPITDT